MSPLGPMIALSADDTRLIYHALCELEDRARDDRARFKHRPILLASIDRRLANIEQLKPKIFGLYTAGPRPAEGR